jgi:hypothetical protein
MGVRFRPSSLSLSYDIRIPRNMPVMHLIRMAKETGHARYMPPRSCQLQAMSQC